MNTRMKLMASLKIWLAIYPSITAFLLLFGAQLAPLPIYLRTLVLTLVLVPWVVFVGVPFVDRIMRSLQTRSTHA